MSPSDQVLLFVCLRRVLLLYVTISAVAGQSITEVVVGDEVVHAVTKLVVGGGGVDSARNITDVDGGDICHREVHSITEEDGNVDDDEVQYAITNEGVGADDDGSDGKLSSASEVLYAASAQPNTAAAGKWHRRIMPTALQPELNSDDGHGQQFDRTFDQIQSSIADRLIATTIIVMLMVVTNGRRASERKKRSGRATWFSPAAALTMLLLVVAASANSATAARPLPAAGGGHNEAAAAAAASGTMPLKAAAPGHSSCTTDPNTQQPVRCIPH
ncbi:uncharacterized protein [Oryza sativa Japonica Group]|uniref:Os09g0366800 protein n=2 Tax=Oryza sativa subsp. japonica TaxID=39947 RepID=A0A0P0XM72_ORYSJ|nr:uncharacterized protein LOC112936478 [Oryza sativa Japonica Group]EAZ44478.1 hypothetical protein OsJ_29096 [Oryza sativa Japonica Group]BAD33467.1 hypothetical protein [Oryza sativa Japonica Group]BAT07737.1 Os09g0366800 [Oryza sativa Japonica Group]